LRAETSTPRPVESMNPTPSRSTTMRYWPPAMIRDNRSRSIGEVYASTSPVTDRTFQPSCSDEPKTSSIGIPAPPPATTEEGFPGSDRTKRRVRDRGRVCDGGGMDSIYDDVRARGRERA